MKQALNLNLPNLRASSLLLDFVVSLRLRQRVHLKLGLEYFVECVERFSCKESFGYRSREGRKDVK